MNRVRLAIYILCVCSIANVPETNGLVQVIRRSMSNLLQLYAKPTPSKVNVREIPIEDEHITSIDLTIPKEHTFEFYKHAMFLYCQILDFKFFHQIKLPKELKDELEHFKENPSPVDEHNATQKLGKLFLEILRIYNVHIHPRNYAEKAYYYDALKWIQVNVAGVNYEPINVFVSNIIDLRVKAVNYLNEITTLSRRNDYFDYTRSELKTLNGWIKQDDHTLALHFIEQMVVTEGKDAVDVTMECTNINIYEHILSDSEPTYLQNILKTDPWTMLRIMDYSFNAKSKQNSNIESPYVKTDIEIEKINLRNFNRGDVKFYKNSLILFVNAFEKKFDVELISSETRNDLLWYPTRMEPYNVLRYCTFQVWAVNVIREMKTNFVQKKEIKSFLDKAYLNRITIWLAEQLEHDNPNVHYCPSSISYYLQVLLYSSSRAHPLYDMAPLGAETDVLHMDVNRENTLQELLQLGKEEDDAVSTILMLVSDQLIADRERFAQEASDLRDLPERTDETMALIQKYESRRDAVKADWDYLIQDYGNPESKILCRHLHVYENLINALDEDNLKSRLYHSKEELLKRIKEALDNPAYNTDDDRVVPLQDSPTHDINNNGRIEVHHEEQDKLAETDNHPHSHLDELD